jgi:hypothetical protein
MLKNVSLYFKRRYMVGKFFVCFIQASKTLADNTSSDYMGRKSCCAFKETCLPKSNVFSANSLQNTF